MLRTIEPCESQFLNAILTSSMHLHELLYAGHFKPVAPAAPITSFINNVRHVLRRSQVILRVADDPERVYANLHGKLRDDVAAGKRISRFAMTISMAP